MPPQLIDRGKQGDCLPAGAGTESFDAANTHPARRTFTRAWPHAHLRADAPPPARERTATRARAHRHPRASAPRFAVSVLASLPI
jgi:hypothetical protein